MAISRKEIIEAIQKNDPKIVTISERGNGWTEDDYYLIKVIKKTQREKFCMIGSC